jgi:hypothetical protein
MPVSYGPVNESVRPGPNATGGSIDLRDLELRVARERADLERAQRELLQARLRAQPRASSAR